MRPLRLKPPPSNSFSAGFARLLGTAHVLALLAWLGLSAGGQLYAFTARASGDAQRELRARRRLQPLLVLEHVAFLLLLITGVLLMREHGWGLTRARWLTLKLGLVAFLVVPLEGMHAFIAHGFIARGLRQTSNPPLAKDLARGLGVEEMLRALAIPLFGIGLPLLVWLSVKKPF